MCHITHGDLWFPLYWRVMDEGIPFWIPLNDCLRNAAVAKESLCFSLVMSDKVCCHFSISAVIL